jgi:LPXTG-motif cell wall-anchored protein
MNNATVQVVAGVICAILIGVLILRRRTKA